MSKWIAFEEVPAPLDRKTKVWAVKTVDGTAWLGEIRWFGRWRCYAFFPYTNTVYERTCLLDIVHFIDAQMLARQEARAKASPPPTTKGTRHGQTTEESEVPGHST